MLCAIEASLAAAEQKLTSRRDVAVGLRTHNPVGYFHVQSLWGSRFDFGRYTAHVFKHLSVGHDVLVVYVTAAIVLGSLPLFLFCVLNRMPLPLLTYCAVLIVIAVGGTHFFTSKPRFLLPAFPLLLPLALHLARSRLRTNVVLLTALAGEPFRGRSYLGGRSVAGARFTVFFEMPRCRAIARIGIWAARCNLRISAQSSTWIIFPPDLDHQDQAGQKIARWVPFDPPSRTSFHPTPRDIVVSVTSL